MASGFSLLGRTSNQRNGTFLDGGSDSTALTGFHSFCPMTWPLPLHKIPRFVGLSLHPLSGILDPCLGLQTPLGCWHYDVPGRMLKMEFLGLSNWSLGEGVLALLTSACSTPPHASNTRGILRMCLTWTGSEQWSKSHSPVQMCMGLAWEQMLFWAVARSISLEL